MKLFAVVRNKDQAHASLEERSVRKVREFTEDVSVVSTMQDPQSCVGGKRRANRLPMDLHMRVTVGKE